MRVLVVEDEVRMANVIKRSLTREGPAVDVAPDEEQAIWMAAAVDYDASVHSRADDYLVKPFALAELHARRRSPVRRGCPPRPTVLCVGLRRKLDEPFGKSSLETVRGAGYRLRDR
jgi:DNA-binding response OmpR family regulator